eukprot:CFRG5867T1
MVRKKQKPKYKGDARYVADDSKSRARAKKHAEFHEIPLDDLNLPLGGDWRNDISQEQSEAIERHVAVTECIVDMIYCSRFKLRLSQQVICQMLAATHANVPDTRHEMSDEENVHIQESTNNEVERNITHIREETKIEEHADSVHIQAAENSEKWVEVMKNKVNHFVHMRVVWCENERIPLMLVPSVCCHGGRCDNTVDGTTGHVNKCVHSTTQCGALFVDVAKEIHHIKATTSPAPSTGTDDREDSSYTTTYAGLLLLNALKLVPQIPAFACFDAVDGNLEVCVYVTTHVSGLEYLASPARAQVQLTDIQSTLIPTQMHGYKRAGCTTMTTTKSDIDTHKCMHTHPRIDMQTLESPRKRRKIENFKVRDQTSTVDAAVGLNVKLKLLRQIAFIRVLDDRFLHTAINLYDKFPSLTHTSKSSTHSSSFLHSFFESIEPDLSVQPLAPQPDGLLVPLLPYQRQAVHWALTKEKPSDITQPYINSHDDSVLSNIQESTRARNHMSVEGTWVQLNRLPDLKKTVKCRLLLDMCTLAPTCTPTSASTATSCSESSILVLYADIATGSLRYNTVRPSNVGTSEPTLHHVPIAPNSHRSHTQRSTTDSNQGRESGLGGMGILADEMGLGKTMELIALILSNPRVLTPATIVDEDLQTDSYPHDSVSPNMNLDVNMDVDANTNAKHIVRTMNPQSTVSTRTMSHKVSWEPTECSSTITDVINSQVASNSVECTPDSTTVNARGNVAGNVSVDVDVAGIVDVDVYKDVDTKDARIADKEPNSTGSTVNAKVSTGSHRTGCPTGLSSDTQMQIGLHEEPVLSVRTTLIVAPLTILYQWASEFESKTDQLRVLVYDGMKHSKNHLTPEEISTYDVVLTSYNVLASDVHYARDRNTRSRRFAAKYEAPRTVLVQIDWWRLCLDEAQMVESGACNPAEMVSRMRAVHRWAITGTPIGNKGIASMKGLLQFINHPIVTSKGLFKRVVDAWNKSEKVAISRANGMNIQSGVEATKGLRCVLGDVMWRTSKRSVQNQLHLPPQHRKEYFLQLNEVETNVYRELAEEIRMTLDLSVPTTHSYTAQSSNTTDLHMRNTQPQITLTSFEQTQHDVPSSTPAHTMEHEVATTKSRHRIISRAYVQRDDARATQLSSMLLRLRQACVHPQMGVYGKGRYGAEYKTMREVLDVLKRQAETAYHSMIRRSVVCSVRVGMAWEFKENYTNALLQYDTAKRWLVDGFQLLDAEYGDEKANVKTGSEKGVPTLPPTITNGSLTACTRKTEVFGPWVTGEWKHWTSLLHLVLFNQASVYYQIEDKIQHEFFFELAEKVRIRLMKSFEETVETDVIRLREFEHKHKDVLINLEDKHKLGHVDARMFVAGHTLVEELNAVDVQLNCLLSHIAEVRASILDVLIEKDLHTDYSADVIAQNEGMDLQREFSNLLKKRKAILFGRTGYGEREVMGTVLNISSEVSDRCRANILFDIQDKFKGYSGPTLQSDAKYLRLLHEQLVVSQKAQSVIHKVLTREVDEMSRLWNSRILFYKKLQELSDAVMVPAPPVDKDAELSHAETSVLLARAQVSRTGGRYRYLSALAQEEKRKEIGAQSHNRTNASVDVDKATRKGNAESADRENVISNGDEMHTYVKPVSTTDNTTHSSDTNSQLIARTQLSNVCENKSNDTKDHAEMDANAGVETYAGPGKVIKRDCLICLSPLTGSVRVLPCGHMFCELCVVQWIARHRQCPFCKAETTVADLRAVVSQPNHNVYRGRVHTHSNNRVHDDNSVRKMGVDDKSLSGQVGGRVRGNQFPPLPDFLLSDNDQVRSGEFNAKVETIVRYLKHLYITSPEVKSIVFSQWKESLKIIARALQANGIHYVDLQGTKSIAIRKFNSDPSITVFLLSGKQQASGLTLVRATHCFLVEPLLDQAMEQQTINRIHRIGQTEPTTVHVFYTKNTIEMNIRDMVKNIYQKKKDERVNKDDDDETDLLDEVAHGSDVRVRETESIDESDVYTDTHES